MKIKVCGITTLEQLQQLESMQIDFAGMIFYEGSKRYLGEKMKSKQSKVKHLSIKKVGVFVNADYNSIKNTIESYNLSAVQLHGDETPELCRQLTTLTKVIKVFRIAGEQDIDAIVAPYQTFADYFLFDTDTKNYGGSGKQFDWNVLASAKINKPFFLSGGIGPEDVEKINSIHHPYLYALDVNSKFETEAGIKDMKKVEVFLSKLLS
jgi:phosphoribosylanthranilate isomerase